MAPERLLKTNEVAKLLGLSDSTVKRLVDKGHLKASRTEGRHRLVSEAEVERYRQKLGETGTVVGADEQRSILPLRTTIQSLLGSLMRGDEAAAQRILAQAYNSGWKAARLGDDLIRPVMEQIGHEWERAGLDVYQEHRISRILESALIGLIRTIPPAGPDAPVAMGCSPSGDHYTLSGLLCELALREQGWHVINLGSNLPLSSLGRAVLRHRPRLVWLSISNLTDQASFVDEYRLFHESVSGSGAAVVLGGSALSPGLRTRVVAASFGERLSHLCEFARSLVSSPGVSSSNTMDRLEFNNP